MNIGNACGMVVCEGIVLWEACRCSKRYVPPGIVVVFMIDG